MESALQTRIYSGFRAMSNALPTVIGEELAAVTLKRAEIWTTHEDFAEAFKALNDGTLAYEHWAFQTRFWPGMTAAQWKNSNQIRLMAGGVE